MKILIAIAAIYLVGFAITFATGVYVKFAARDEWELRWRTIFLGSGAWPQFVRKVVRHSREDR